MELKIENAIDSILEVSEWAAKAARRLRTGDIQEGLSLLKTVVMSDLNQAIEHLSGLTHESEPNDQPHPTNPEPRTVYGERTL